MPESNSHKQSGNRVQNGDGLVAKFDIESWKRPQVKHIDLSRPRRVEKGPSVLLLHQLIFIMLQDQLSRGSFKDINLFLDKSYQTGSESLVKFVEAFKLETDNLTFDELGNRNTILVQVKEERAKQPTKSKRTKQKQVDVGDIIAKYSQDLQFEPLALPNREVLLYLFIYDRKQAACLDDMLADVLKCKSSIQKNIIILEEVKEAFLAQNQNIDEFLLKLQIEHNVDYIITKTQQQTINEILSCIDSVLQLKRKGDKVPCLFRPRMEANLMKSETAGISNTYQLMWLQMLTQINGISESKARAIVTKYPSIKSLIQAYQSIDLEKRPYMLADLEVKQGLIQQTGKKLGNKISELIYLLFTSKDPEQKLQE